LYGISLSTSPLGATYGILTARPVWYSPSAPVLFILSAIAAGPALTLLVTIVSGELMQKRLVPEDVMQSVARFVGFASLAYLYLKLWSWLAVSYYSHVPGPRAGFAIQNENTPKLHLLVGRGADGRWPRRHLPSRACAGLAIGDVGALMSSPAGRQPRN